jgi:hypothetical protein
MRQEFSRVRRKMSIGFGTAMVMVSCGLGAGSLSATEVVGGKSNGGGQTTPLAGLSKVMAMAAGGSHNLALRAAGTMVTWGDNEHGQSRSSEGLRETVANRRGRWTSLGRTAQVAANAFAGTQRTGGHLHVSPNGRFLVRKDAKPFFWLGDTAWELFHRLDPADTEHYLKTRAEQGFNVVQCVLLAEMKGLSVPTPAGHLPFVEGDLSRPNEAYFRHVDWVVDRAAQHGIYLALLPTWGAYVHGNGIPKGTAVFDAATAEAYGRFLGHRYRDRWNLIWIIGGDRVPTGKEQVWKALAAGIRAGDDGRHLMTYHVSGGHSSSEFWHAEPWLDFNMIQSGHPPGPFSNNYDLVRNDYAKQPVKPTLDGEPLYEDMPLGFVPTNGRATAHHVRANAYWAVFAGAFGHTYGANGVFQMCVPDGPCEFWGRVSWREALRFPGARQMKHLKHLILSRPYFTRIPDQQALDPVPIPGAAHAQLTRDGTPGRNDATYLMVYYSYVTWIHRIKTSVIDAKRLVLWWYDPRTGQATRVGEFDNPGRLDLSWKPRLAPPTDGPDWVLVIDAAERNYPPPGSPPARRPHADRNAQRGPQWSRDHCSPIG